MATNTTTTTIKLEQKRKSDGGAGAARVKKAIPFAVQCGRCGRHTSKGVKLRGLKEVAGMDPSFDIEIYRFRFNCLWCNAAFSIITDPGRYDYVLEAGATPLPKKI